MTDQADQDLVERLTAKLHAAKPSESAALKAALEAWISIDQEPSGTDEIEHDNNQYSTVLSFELDLTDMLLRGPNTAQLEAVFGNDIALMIELKLLSPKTWNAAKARGTIATATAERILRAARIFAHARQTFGDRAAMWLARENKALEGASPIKLLRTETGAHAVRVLLGRIDHGIAA